MWKRVSVSTPIQWCEGLYLTWAFSQTENPQHSNEVVGFLAERLALHGARALPAVHVRYVAQRLAEAQ
jgi:hypothetical protein